MNQATAVGALISIVAVLVVVIYGAFLLGYPRVLAEKALLAWDRVVLKFRAPRLR